MIFSYDIENKGRTDISYLENRFYNKALVANQYAVQNGNEPTIGTVTEEKADELEEFMDYAELILGALGYKVFEASLDYIPSEKNALDEESRQISNTSSVLNIPELPDESLDVGLFIHTAMRNLSDAGYCFSEEQIKQLLDKDASKAIFNIFYPFMKVFDESEENPHHIKGTSRFYSPYLKGKSKSKSINKNNIFTFGGVKYLLSKETFDKYHNKEHFIQWYKALKGV